MTLEDKINYFTDLNTRMGQPGFQLTENDKFFNKIR